MKISFIIPCYNVAPFLDRCISSISGFGFPYEIIAVNDGSKDNTLDVLKNLSLKKSALKILSKENEGVLAARRDGWRISCGEYVCFIDADDEINSLALQEIVAKYSGFDMVRCGGWRVSKNEKTKITGKYCGKITSAEEAAVRMMDKEMLPFMWGVLYKRSLLDDECFSLDKRFKIGEDFLFNLYAIKRATSIYCADSSFYLYNDNEFSVMNSKIWGTAYIRDFNDILSSVLVSISPRMEYYADRHRFVDYIGTLFFSEVEYDKNVYREARGLLLQHPEFIMVLPKKRRLFFNNERLFWACLYIYKVCKKLKNRRTPRAVLQ